VESVRTLTRKSSTILDAAEVKNKESLSMLEVVVVEKMKYDKLKSVDDAC
jgi:hypothetical protein